jgi:hypothetical protein
MVRDVEAMVADLRGKGVAFEDYDLPGVKTVNGIAELGNKTVQEWEAARRPPPGQRPGEGVPIGSFRGPAGELVPWPRYAVGVATADFDGDIEYAPLWAGPSCSVVNDLNQRQRSSATWSAMPRQP